MLAPVLITSDGQAFVLPQRNSMAENFLDAYSIGAQIEVNTGWQFTNSFIDVNVAYGIHAQYEGLVVVRLSEEYARIES